jgi:hypothetical protein
MRPSLLWIWIVAVLVILGCNLSSTPVAQTLSTAGGGPKTSFDDPKNNATVPMGAVKIQIHAQDPRGVARAEFSVNGKRVSSQESPDPKQNNVAFTFAWEPAAAGDYLLQARAQNSLGVWGQDTIISVHVGKKTGSTNAEPSATQTQQATTAVPPTATPTVTLTATSQAISFTPDVTPKKIAGKGGPCNPKDLLVQVTVTGQVDNVVVFFKLFDYTSYAGLTDYTSGTALSPKGGGVYSKTFNSNDFPSLPPPPPFRPAVWVGYQFAAERFPPGGGDAVVVARSNTYSDITLNVICPL